MRFYFQSEDERAIIHDQAPDPIAQIVAQFLIKNFSPEIAYMHRWNDGYTYDGTAHSATETILFSVRDNSLIYLPKSKMGKFVEGRSIAENPASCSISLESL